MAAPARVYAAEPAPARIPVAHMNVLHRILKRSLKDRPGNPPEAAITRIRDMLLCTDDRLSQLKTLGMLARAGNARGHLTVAGREDLPLPELREAASEWLTALKWLRVIESARPEEALTEVLAGMGERQQKAGLAELRDSREVEWPIQLAAGRELYLRTDPVRGTLW